MKCAAMVGVFALAGVASADVVTFEELGAQPILFSGTTALRNQIAGVSFSGPGERDGGAILDQDGGFGFDARSGRNFLAFSRFALLQDFGRATDPQRITFDAPVRSVQIYAATTPGFMGVEVFGTYLIQAFTADGSLIDQSTFAVGTTWTALSVSSSQEFDYVVLTETTGVDSFAYDDLSYSSVPSAGGAGLLALAGAVGARRRRA